jgi:hypothetical protein
MDSIRRLIGLFILLGLGVTTLVGMTWAVGVTRAVFDERFLADIPKAIIEEAPGIADELYEAGLQPGAIEDANNAAWFAAAGKVGVKPSELLEKIGLSSWLESEVVGVINDVGRFLGGELDPKEIKLDFRPLKAALSSTEAREYFIALLNKLPPCSEAQKAIWMSIEGPRDGLEQLPACNPDLNLSSFAVDMVVANVVNLPDEKQLFEDHVELPWGIDASRIINTVMWALFLIPLAFITVGANLMSFTRRGFLVASGFGVVLGGGVPLVTASLVGKSLVEILQADPGQWRHYSDSAFWNNHASDILAKKIGDLLSLVFELLFEPVEFIGLIVCMVGLVLIAVSFFASSERRIC